MDLFTSLVQLLQTEATDAATTLAVEDLVSEAQEPQSEEETLFADGERGKLGNSYCVVA